ncbi:hypothetical protein BKA67DRAFT_656829 [Truncatella angustata]|uniref:Uncharacterized protein n=1 Tax=Truncatella angustata TaxID=152316 RepID=A0A9P8UVB9_9PEZI|nr:uncharacterized protein BKA67DRAFT_656829 [Truncatella angustata]KAH6658680.1 hypothetical protein BKA67DRAFT_656829 [Truncatella angustata]
MQYPDHVHGVLASRAGECIVQGSELRSPHHHTGNLIHIQPEEDEVPGEKPMCSFCQRLGQPCTYLSRSRPAATGNSNRGPRSWPIPNQKDAIKSHGEKTRGALRNITRPAGNDESPALSPIIFREGHESFQMAQGGGNSTSKEYNSDIHNYNSNW